MNSPLSKEEAQRKTCLMVMLETVFLGYYHAGFSETCPAGASVHGRGKAGPGGGAWLGFNVADCAPMKKGTVSSVLIFNFVAVCVPSLCVQFFFPP